MLGSRAMAINQHRVYPSLRILWSTGTIFIGSCILLSITTFHCYYNPFFKTEKNQDESHRVKVSLFNLTCPLFKVIEKDDHLNTDLPYFKLRNTRVTFLPTDYEIEPRRHLCQQGEATLLILIPSVVKDDSLRMAIRETWASGIYESKGNQYRHIKDKYQLSQTVKLVFVFGIVGLKPKEIDILEEESRAFNDILTLNFIDSYANLSLKVSSSLLWSVRMCRSVKYVAKIDVDTLLNIPLLLILLEQMTHTDALVLGHKHAFSKPLVIRKGNWAVPEGVYPFQFFPQYVYGHSYVLTRSSVDRIVSCLPYFPIIPNEDAFITGVMPLLADVTRVHSAAFTNLFRKQSCFDIQYGRFVSSGHRKKNLRQVWSQIQTRNCTGVSIS